MIQITPGIVIREDEIQIHFLRASGPGGQHVNKTSSAVQLRFDIKNSTSLPEEVRDRLLRSPDRRINMDGILVITAQRFRSQEQNRRDAIQRLVDLIGKSILKPKRRLKTKPTWAAKKRRLENKRLHSVKKSLRQRVSKNDPLP